MRVFALTFGDRDTPSTLFRLHQYVDALRERGVTLDFAVAKPFEEFERLAAYDVTLVELALLSTAKVRAVRRHARALVYDACDRIWLRPGKPYDLATRTRQRHRRRAIARGADLCLAANGVIRADLLEAGARRVELLPMSVDTNVWHPRGRAEASETVTIGWSGSPGNLVFLESLVPALRELQGSDPRVRVAIHCGKRPDFPGLDFAHLPFEPGREPDAVRTFDVGLLPLPDDPFVRGKSPIKALQYMACDVAVVGEGIGATAELLEHDTNALTVADGRTWTENLQRLIDDPSLRARLVAAGRERIASTYSMSAVVDRFVALLRSVAPGAAAS